MLNKIIGVVVLCAVLAAGIYAGRVTSPRLFVYDLKSDSWVPLPLSGDTKVVVIGPSGMQPGVEGGRSSDGKGVLIAPPELMQDQGEQKAAPQSFKPRTNNDLKLA